MDTAPAPTRSWSEYLGIAKKEEPMTGTVTADGVMGGRKRRSKKTRRGGRKTRSKRHRTGRRSTRS